MNTDPIAAFQKRHIDHVAVLVAALGLAVVLLVGGLVILRNEEIAVKQARTDRVRIMADLDAIVNLSADKKTADALLPALDTELPQSLDIPVNVIPAVKALAAARNVKIDFKLDSNAPTSFDGFSGFGFILRAEGTLTAVDAFFSDLENAKNIMSVSDWNIARTGASTVDLTAVGFIYARLGT